MIDAKDLTTHRLAYLWRVRVKKEESAFVYTVFESHEGWLAYTTLDGDPGANHRDIDLQIPYHYRDDVRELLESLGDLLYVLDAPEVPREALPRPGESA